MADRLDEAMDALAQAVVAASGSLPEEAPALHARMAAARQAVHDAAREVYAAAIAAREQEVATLRGEAACSTCGGAPHPLGLVCVCGGSNKAWREAQGLREELVRRQMAMGEYPAIPAAWSEITPAALADLRAQLAAREQELWDVRGDLRMTQVARDEYLTDNDDLRAQIAAAQEDTKNAVATIDTLIAQRDANAADRERMNWLDANGFNEDGWNLDMADLCYGEIDIRAAIDKARNTHNTTGDQKP